jgi:hypothetical protein
MRCEIDDAPSNEYRRMELLPLAEQLNKGSNIVHPGEFAGGISREMATLPQIRAGKKWITTAQILTVLVPLEFVGG